MSVIRTSGLGVNFGQPVLRDVSIDITAGEFVALMGANGTGKTTLIRSLLGLIKADEGRAWLFDTPTSEFRQWQRVAYVPQHLIAANAVPVSVEEAVRSALANPKQRWRPLSREQRSSISSALKRVGLEARGKDRLEDLSGGQQRRVMIARALVTGADLLIMDEPTAGVDQGEQTRLAGHMQDLHEAGATIILITHDLGPVASLATRAIVLGQPSQNSVRYDGPTPPPARWTEHVWHHSHDAEPEPRLLEDPVSLLDFDFMRRALLAAVVVGMVAPAIGVFLVQRRLALLGDGMGHVALTGVGLAFLTGSAPVPTALVVVVAGAIGIEVLRIRSRSAGDVILALVFYGGIAGGVLLTYLAGNRAASSLNQYLFGAITTVSSQDLVWLVGASLALLVILAVFGREMFAVSFDPEVARTQGIRTGFIGVMITILAAVAVVIGMRTVGLLLVSAVMIVPIAAAQQVTRSFRGTAGVGILVGLFSAVGGVITSFYLDVPSGATIVLITLACFVAALGLAAVIRRTA